MRRPYLKHGRSGFTMTELLVSASLLIVGIGTMVPLSIHNGQMWRDTRNQQLAMNEMANQLERLIALDPAERQTALIDIQPSTALRRALPQAKLSARVVDDEHVIVSLVSDARSKPLTLIGWIDPLPADESEGDLQ